MAEQTKSGTPEVWAAGIGRKSRAEYGSDLMAEMLRELGIKYIASRSQLSRLARFYRQLRGRKRAANDYVYP